MRHTILAILVSLFGCQPQQSTPIADTSKPTAKPVSPDAASDPSITATPAADVITGRVVRVIDGDTMVVLVNEEQVKVRLEGIDCPARLPDADRHLPPNPHAQDVVLA